MNEKKPGGAKKWLMFGGCGCVVMMLVCGGGISLIYGGIRKMMTSSNSYTEAMQMLETSPDAADVLGTPLKVGFLFSGSINITNGTESSDFSFPVEGPKGKGRVYVSAVCRQRQCDFGRLDLVVGSRRIDLAQAAAEAEDEEDEEDFEGE